MSYAITLCRQLNHPDKMKVFVTGAGGYIGAVLTNELIQNGHQVIGLTRSDKSAKIIKDAGGEVIQGSIEDLGLLKKGAKEADGVIQALSLGMC